MPFVLKPRAPKPALDRMDVYERVTNRILAALEQGTRPWMRPWEVAGPDGHVSRPLRSNGQPYQGVNVFLLWSAAIAAGYTNPMWITYKQALELGGSVRKGETGELVVYANRLTRAVEGKGGQEERRSFYFMKGYTVFNVEQCEGLPERMTPTPDADMPLETRVSAAVAFFQATGANVRHGGNRAFYDITSDRIQLPPVKRFKGQHSYAATYAHELVHWTGAGARLKRTFGTRFGDEQYAREELVAELGSAFLCADLGIIPEVQANHESYIGRWVKLLQQDKRAIFQAASQAQRAANYLHDLQAPSVALAA